MTKDQLIISKADFLAKAEEMWAALCASDLARRMEEHRRAQEMHARYPMKVLEPRAPDDPPQIGSTAQ